MSDCQSITFKLFTYDIACSFGDVLVCYVTRFQGINLPLIFYFNLFKVLAILIHS